MRPTDRLLNLLEVMEVTRLSKPTIYKLLRSGQFPRQVHLRPHRVVWLYSEVLDWWPIRRHNGSAPDAKLPSFFAG